jgi:hypothetical protein
VAVGELEGLVAQVQGHCRANLAAYKCPKQIVMVAQLPRNAMGKLQKNVLVEQLGASVGGLQSSPAAICITLPIGQSDANGRAFLQADG